MREHSTYELFCVCGNFIVTESNNFICKKCGRAGEIQSDSENYKKLNNKPIKTITGHLEEEKKC